MNDRTTQFVKVFVVMVMPSFINEFYNFQKLKDQANPRIGEIDFIIVGGGTAGAVLANRLSKKHRVLLLERGGHPGPSGFTAVPFLASLISGTNMDYYYETVELKNVSKAYIVQSRKFSRGKGLGGSSNLNNMMYVRGQAEDFDSWAKQTKSDIWSSTNVSKYHKRIENYHGNYPGPSHGTGNEQFIGKLAYTSPMQQYFFDTLKEKNIPTGDSSVVPGTVFSYPDVIIKDGERWGTYRGFIKPILHRKKLTISLFSDVIKIHLNYETKPRAFGVTYQKNGVDYFVSVKKEIIVSAGVIESPKLLLLSGIGPKNHLESVQIKPLIDLPVGMTYISQPYVALKFQINESISIIVNRDLNDNAFLNYYTHRNGPLATPLARFGIGYSQGIKTANQKYRTYYYIFNGLGGDASSEHELFSKDSDLKPGIYEKFYKPQADKDGFFVEIECVRVKSSGTIRLATKNPKDRPLIDPNYFSNLNDMDCLIDGIVYMVDLIESGSPMQKIDAHVPPIAFPGCETLEFKSRSYWECYIRQLTGSPDAGRSTCRMGDGSKLSEKTAVIDPEFCVLGVKGLRVIDASSIPTVATSNLMAITIMLGEIGSELILDKWEKGVKIESKTNSSTIIY